MKLSKQQFEKARRFIYKNARSLDLYRWQYHFENGSKENVLKALSYYQNDDGGMGHALEPDVWNPDSVPIATSRATGILEEIEYYDTNSKLIKNIFAYLESEKDFIDGKWLFAVESNNDYPHSQWFHYSDSSNINYNPTIQIAGFVLKCADKNSTIYKKCKEIALKAVSEFLDPNIKNEMHLTGCFVNFHSYCVDSDIKNSFDFIEFESILNNQIKKDICDDIEKWNTNYVAKPSWYIDSSLSHFYKSNKELCEYECEFIINNMEEDGAYKVTWSWNDYLDKFPISANWWRSSMLIENMLYLKNFDKISF